MTRVLVTGGTGLLGGWLVPALRARGHAVISHGLGAGREARADLAAAAEARRLVAEAAPAVVVNLAALADVDASQADPQRAFLLNTRLVENLAAALADALPGAHLVQISTDQVYDGPGPHSEEDPVIRNTYALSKYAGELAALRLPGATVLRTNFFGPSRTAGRRSFSDAIIEGLRARRPMTLFTDMLVSPLTMGTLCEMIALAVENPRPGVFNLGSREGMSKRDLAHAIAARLGLPADSARDGLSTDAALAAPRPRDMRMDVSRFERAWGVKLPTLAEEVARMEVRT